MLECLGSLCLNTCPKTDTCQHASTELAKPPVQGPGGFRLADLVRDQQCAGNLLGLRGGRPRLRRNRARTDLGLQNSRLRMREAPQGPARHTLACPYPPNKD